MDQLLRLSQRYRTDKPTSSEPSYFKLLFKKNRKEEINFNQINSQKEVFHSCPLPKPFLQENT